MTLLALPAAILVFKQALALGRGLRIAVALVLMAAIALLPFVLPPANPVGRALLAIACGTVVIRMVDLLREGARDRSLSFREAVEFWSSPFCLVRRALPRELADDRRLRILRGAAYIVLGGLALAAAMATSFETFWIEHAIKAPLIFMVTFGISDLLVVAWWTAGGRGRAMMGNVFGAATPAELWRRYNRPVTQFFREDVYVGGVSGVLAVFLLSGLVHEYIAFAAIGRIQPFQMSFFLAQGLGVALTHSWRPKGAWRWAGIAATFVFTVATLSLFLASAQQLVPIYTSPLPRWIVAWNSGP